MRVLQTAAGSVLGRMVIAICKKRGVRTINVVRRSEAKQELLDLGCARAPCYLAPPLVAHAVWPKRRYGAGHVEEV
jgi:NADPH:quinone reductase-like Zn-dependent oxidoreductase